MVIHRLAFSKNSQLPELLVERPLREGGLSNICTIKVVHAVRSHCTGLHFGGFSLGVVEAEPTMK